MPRDELYTPQEAAGYNFGDTAAPEGADATRTPFESPEPGIHEFEVIDFGVTQDKKEFKWKGAVCNLFQLRPNLQVVGGHATIMTFLPMPTPGVVMIKEIAEQWMQFVHALGFDIPPGSMVPNGFKLPDILHKHCKASVVLDLDRDKNQKTDDKGRPRVKIDLFGFMRVDAPGKPSGNGSAAKPAAAPAPKPADVMDDL